MRGFIAFTAACIAGSTACGGELASQHDAAADSTAGTDTDAAQVQGCHAFDIAGFEIPPAPIERIWLGINNLPESMMGNGTAGPPFAWAVPEQDWTIEVHAVYGEGADPTAVPVLQAEAPDGSLIPLVLQAAWSGWWAYGHWQAQVTAALPPGPLRLHAHLPGVATTGSDKRRTVTAKPIDVQVAVRTPALDPFDSVDHWQVTFSRDLGTLQVAAVGDGFSVKTLDKPNGIADFDEAMAALGLQGGDEVWNAKVLDVLRNRIKELLRTFYRLDPATGALLPDSVRVQFHFDGGPQPPAGVALSRIALGGDAPKIDGKRTLFGRAWIDPRNANANDNTGPGHGVFSTSMVRTVLGNPLALVLLDGVLPAGGGKPFGSVAGDHWLLYPDARPLPGSANEEVEARRVKFQLLMKFMGIGLAAVTAHEIGHSLGLVHPGLPPHGMLGGVTGPWILTESDPHHIDTPGPNLMQTGSSFNPMDILKELPAFSPMEYGYLRGLLLVLPK